MLWGLKIPGCNCISCQTISTLSLISSHFALQYSLEFDVTPVLTLMGAQGCGIVLTYDDLSPSGMVIVSDSGQLTLIMHNATTLAHRPNKDLCLRLAWCGVDRVGNVGVSEGAVRLDRRPRRSGHRPRIRDRDRSDS